MNLLAEEFCRSNLVQWLVVARMCHLVNLANADACKRVLVQNTGFVSLFRIELKLCNKNKEKLRIA